MSLLAARERHKQLLASIGRAGVHATFPDDFEYYLCAFELENFEGEVVDMLIFPVMPNQINESHQTLSTVKKGSHAVVSLFNPSFDPFDISINGTFGRKFRILLGDTEPTNAAAFSFTIDDVNEFNAQIKTGYGVTKMLQKIIYRSFELDNENRPYRLYFHNMAFNSSHIVEVKNHTYNQSEYNNMMWDYSVFMTALAPALAVRDESANRSSMINLLKFDNVSKFTNTAAGLVLENFQIAQNRLFNV
jgi:hypothetical protein